MILTPAPIKTSGALLASWCTQYLLIHLRFPTIQRPSDLSAILCSDIVLLNSKRSLDSQLLTYRQLFSAPMNIRRPGHTALSLTTLLLFGNLARF